MWLRKCIYEFPCVRASAYDAEGQRRNSSWAAAARRRWEFIVIGCRGIEREGRLYELRSEGRLSSGLRSFREMACVRARRDIDRIGKRLQYVCDRLADDSIIVWRDAHDDVIYIIAICESL